MGWWDVTLPKLKPRKGASDLHPLYNPPSSGTKMPRVEPTLDATTARGADSTRKQMWEHASLLLDSSGVIDIINKAVKRLDNNTYIWSDCYPDDFEKICKALKVLGYHTTKTYENKKHRLEIRW